MLSPCSEQSPAGQSLSTSLYASPSEPATAFSDEETEAPNTEVTYLIGGRLGCEHKSVSPCIPPSAMDWGSPTIFRLTQVSWKPPQMSNCCLQGSGKVQGGSTEGPFCDAFGKGLHATQRGEAACWQVDQIVPRTQGGRAMSLTSASSTQWRWRSPQTLTCANSDILVPRCPGWVLVGNYRLESPSIHSTSTDTVSAESN